MNIVKIVTIYANKLHNEVIEKQVCMDELGHGNLENKTKLAEGGREEGP